MYSVYTLKNGMRVVLEPMEHYRSASAGLWVKVGSANENKYNNGMAHVIEHMLFKGTAKRSAKAIADEMTAIGGNLDAYTSKECTCYYTQTLDEHLFTALDIIADMIINSKIDANDLKKELGVILEEIDMYEDDPDELVHELLQMEVYKDQPIGYMISGEKETVSHFTREAVIEFMRTWYTAPNMVLSIAGHFDTEKTLRYAEQLFSPLECRQAVQNSCVPVYTPRLITRHKDIEQMHLDLAYRCIPYNHDDKYVFSIVNSIIGGNLNSRLFQEIREERGLAYTVYSYGSSYRQCGLFQIYAAMNPGQLKIVYDAILNVINGLDKRPITQKELSLTKEQIKTELIIASESTRNRMESNGKALIYDEEIVTLDETLNIISKINLSDIERFADTYLCSIQPAVCIVGNLEQIDMTDLDREIRGGLSS